MSEIGISIKLDPEESVFVKTVLQQYVKVTRSGIEKLKQADEFHNKEGMLQFMKAEIEKAELLLIRFNLQNNIN